ncbi:DUF6020 family protein [Enterococcus casseliflavus]|uniref:DUF6020 family protein n=1 Tax=Enterococcus casseliflavus TaxID=37734 RepID=UPI0025437D30|nr:DUF6020 family protein [Enterococcus casseliflavus]MDK4451083.1 DUF6020 family protein [Enterococcus casseliflavus]
MTASVLFSMMLFQDIKVIIGMSVINFILLFFLSDSVKKRPYSRLTNFFISFLFATIMGISLIPSEILTTFNLIFSMQGIYLLGTFAYFLCFFSALQDYLLISSQENSKRKVTSFWVYTLAFFLMSSIYLYAYYPGIFFPDSINQWDQIQTSNVPWNDWHPVGHTFVIMATSLGKYPVGFIVFQIVIYSLIMAYFCDFIREFVGSKFATISCIFFIAIPIFPLASIYIVKDSLFTYTLLLVTLYLVRIIISQGKWLNKISNLALLYFTLLGFVFFRHNGWPALLVSTLVFAVFLFRKKFIKLFVVIGLVVFSYQVITGPIYNHFNVIRSDSTESLGIFVQISAAIIKYDGTISKEEMTYLETLMPKEDWKNLYQPNNVDNIKFKERFKKQVIKDDPKKFLETVLGLIIRNPGLTLEAYMKQTEILWHANFSLELDNLRPIFRNQLSGQQGPFFFMTREQREEIDPDYEGLNLDEITKGNNRVRNQLLELQNWILKSRLYVLLMPALYFILFLFSMVMLIVKNKTKLIIAFMPYVLVMGTIFVAIPAQDIRYALPNLFIGILGLATVKGRFSERVSENAEN